MTKALRNLRPLELSEHLSFSVGDNSNSCSSLDSPISLSTPPMAVSQDRKRQLADQLSQDSPSPVKSTSQHHDSWQYPPEFWDRLSKVWLTPDALEEIDRRTAKTPSFPPPRLSGQDNSHTTTTRELRRFAGHGGPDLTHLRGVRFLIHIKTNIL